ncbi:sodium:solute symporter family protein [Roseivirga sp. E12]|uniref:sodium:solute symporter family protein n=1 Tax=Roseivirga sp. E12 TaxID=2819237 RepID=UPI001ABC6FD9|nr:sodium:solute symporter family protein [Roseivirga sp. E12]MBO3699677.1 Na+:solute symporter [Roseivirga sp. E12]
MNLSSLDWTIIIVFFAVFLVIGIRVSKKAGSSSKEFFLSGRNMPWWLLGVSMVATTFSADTPNLVTDIVRQNGVAGNWTWWAFLITGMFTVFIYAKLWRRSGVLTDLEFYEKRYSGKEAAFLRGFRAIYLGVFFNVMIMATVSLAAIKIGEVMFGLEPWKTVVYASLITVAYSSLGGLRGVILTDFLQFIVAMVGSIAAAIYIVNLPEVGGLTALIERPEIASKLSLIPDINNQELFITLLIIPIAVQWWSVWYPGSEPGGGGYIAQRMLSAKDEKNAVSATLLFNITHYALRPWPWILIALASLVVYPDLASIREAFPNISEGKMGHDLGYSAMLLTLPKGLLGIVIASLIAAFMSTISTHLNWGSSYVAFDFYQRFVKPEASDKELVNVGRISTVVLMVLAGLFALVLSSAYDAFQILLSIGAGTGSIFLLRWFWWRINAYSEITGMIVSFVFALLLNENIGPEFLTSIKPEFKLLLSVGVTTVAWVVVTLMTRPTDYKTLASFFNKAKPYGNGWNGFKKIAKNEGIALESGTGKSSIDILAVFLGIIAVYSALFSTGMFIYGKMTNGVILLVVALAAILMLRNTWRKLKF